jgi:ribonuclease-3
MRSILEILHRRRAERSDKGSAARRKKPSAARLKDLRRLESRLDYSFRDAVLLDAALTHRSFAYELQASERSEITPQDYEALEFLGDSVLGLVVSEYLFRSFPAHLEGALSKMKSYLVSTSHLAKISEGLGLGEFLRLSHGEEKTGGRNKRAILADLFESLTAAIYLDGGLEVARRFLLEQLGPSLSRLAQRDGEVFDYKSTLQETLHQLGFAEPRYRVISEEGPPHRRQFRVEVSVGGRSLATGEGRSKKEAQQKAARAAMEQMGEAAASPPDS